MQRIRELDSMRRECQCRSHGCTILNLYIPEAQQSDKRFADRAVFKSVKAAQDPLGFEQHRLRDPDGPGFKQRPGGGSL